MRGSSSLRGKEKMIEVEDNVVLEEFEKELQDIDFGDSKEEVEGHAPLLDNEDYDYIREGTNSRDAAPFILLLLVVLHLSFSSSSQLSLSLFHRD
ncbi:hypothetical protein JHK86_055575 [Glycine max]|nr:hypothetical protein JHK86_055575 [Glycine max]